MGEIHRYFLSVSRSKVAALLFVIKFLFVDMANSGPGAVFITVLTIAFVLSLSSFATFAVAYIIFTGCPC